MLVSKCPEQPPNRIRQAGGPGSPAAPSCLPLGGADATGLLEVWGIPLALQSFLINHLSSGFKSRGTKGLVSPRHAGRVRLRGHRPRPASRSC